MAESSNSQNSVETELTMCDVLEEEQELEDDANAVLGGSDDTNCSYDKGYVSRQALYACLTCSVNQEPSGICLACSYKCHDGHEIVELYTKRNFRCDCGNSKFSGKICLLKPDKEPINSLNKYNQNFRGLYCSCARPYPDLEDDTVDEMIQCVMCEDWYHGRHIGSEIPNDYFEMICTKCMESHKFLYSYLKFLNVNVSEESEKCNGTSKSQSLSSNIEETKLSPEQSHCSGASVKEEEPDTSSGLYEFKQNETYEQMLDCIKKEQKSEILSAESAVKSENSEVCGLKLGMKSDGIITGPAFWPENWRKELCQCSSCLEMYQKYNCAYLLNLDDTILAYEERGKSTTESQYDRGLTALSQLDRVKQMEAIRAYMNMKGQLKEYLREFANNKRTVCENDIKEFFDRFSKRQKLNNGVPHFCR